MNDPLGLSFSLFGDNNNGPTSGQSRGGSAPTPQDAIRVLSFRPPRTVGAASPVAGPLLNAPGGAAFGGSGMDLEQLLAMLFGQRPGQVGTQPMPPRDLFSPGGGQTASFQAPGLQAPAPEAPPPPSRSAPNPSVGFGQDPGVPWDQTPTPPPFPHSGPSLMGERNRTR